VAPLGSNNLPLLFSLGNGNAPRNNERGHGYWNTDLSLSKRFALFGSHRLTLRADALNVFNQDQYGNPTASMTSVSFGQNLNNWGNRSITLGAKYSF
jgi:hypothetical protein